MRTGAVCCFLWNNSASFEYQQEVYFGLSVMLYIHIVYNIDSCWYSRQCNNNYSNKQHKCCLPWGVSHKGRLPFAWSAIRPVCDTWINSTYACSSKKFSKKEALQETSEMPFSCKLQDSSPSCINYPGSVLDVSNWVLHFAELLVADQWYNKSAITCCDTAFCADLAK